MIRIENHCCGCAAPGYPCLGSRCPNRRVEVHYCDKCDAELFEEEQETSEDGRELCDDCREEEENDD